MSDDSEWVVRIRGRVGTEVCVLSDGPEVEDVELRCCGHIARWNLLTRRYEWDMDRTEHLRVRLTRYGAKNLGEALIRFSEREDR